MSNRNALITLLLLFLALALPAIANKDLWPPDEPRYAEIAREMRLSGDYLVTRLNNEPYREKPPLLFWSIAASSLPFGEVTEIAARLPSVISGGLTLALTYLLALQLFGPRIAWWSGIVMITSIRFWLQSTTGQIDMLLAACMTASLFAFYQWDRQRNARWLAVFYLGIALGLLAKGPPAVVFPVLLALAYYWRDKREWLRMHLPWAVLLSALPVALWLVLARTQAATELGESASNAIASNLFFQVVGRLFLGASHAHGPLYYFYNLPADLLPWALFLPYVIPHVWRRRKESSAIRLLLCWTVPAFIFFSLSTGKRAVYLVPLLPALSILLSVGIVDLMDNVHTRWRIFAGRAWIALLLILACVPVAARFTNFQYGWEPRLLLFSVFGVLAAAYVAWSLRKHPSSLPQTIAAQMALVMLFSVFAVLPSLNVLKSAKSFCLPLQQLTRNNTEYVLYSLNINRPEYTYYTEQFYNLAKIDFIFQEDGTLDELSILEITKQREKKLQKAAEVLPKTPATASAQQATAFQNSMGQEIQVSGAENAANCSPTCRLIKRSRIELERLRTDAPVFMIAEERTWRWVVAVNPNHPPVNVLQLQRIGRREMVLVANPAGGELFSGPSENLP